MRFAVSTVLLLMIALQPRVAEPLRFVRAIELPGVEGRMDIWDAAAHRLIHRSGG